MSPPPDPHALFASDFPDIAPWAYAVEAKFHEQMLGLYWSAGNICGYWANYFLRSVRNNGGLACARKFLAKPGEPQPGFLKLIEAGRPDITVEALVLKPEFRSLFTNWSI
jgi:5-methylcytosine-specific restriction protein A